jgi:hypothetical protein
MTRTSGPVGREGAAALERTLRPKYEQHIAHSDAKEHVPTDFLADQVETKDVNVKSFCGVEIVRVHRGFYNAFDIWRR